MIQKVYNKYFQKSRAFLFPLLGILRKDKFNPVETYMSFGEIVPEDRKLFCLFKRELGPAYRKFEEKVIVSNPLYLETIEIGDDNVLHVFDYSPFKRDWDLFLDGKYSELSLILKNSIKDYYGEKGEAYTLIKSFLYPERYFENYAELLEVDVKNLKEVGQLCDPYDREKEILKINLEVTKI